LEEKRNLARDESELVELGKFIPLEHQVQLQHKIEAYFRQPGKLEFLQLFYCLCLTLRCVQMPSNRLSVNPCASSRICCCTCSTTA
jgi:hypothetical protein